MSAREPALKQPETFEISEENLKLAKSIIAKYPHGKQRSAVIPVLDLVQRQAGGWLPVVAMNAVADLLEIPYIKVYEVASFYTMFNLKPIGENFIQVCRTTPCWLRGSDEITKICKSKLGIEVGENTPDGKFTLHEVECLGACVNAPMVQVNDDYYEDLSSDIMGKIIDDLSDGREVKVGTQISRQTSAPIGGLTTLKDIEKKDGK